MSKKINCPHCHKSLVEGFLPRHVRAFHKSKINKYNLLITSQISEIEKNEKEEMHTRNMAMIAASKNN